MDHLIITVPFIQDTGLDAHLVWLNTAVLKVIGFALWQPTASEQFNMPGDRVGILLAHLYKAPKDAFLGYVYTGQSCART